MEIEIRAVIHFLFLRGENNKTIHQMINETYGEKTVGLRTVQKWAKRFIDGKMDL